ncbi:MAG: hypothetical protein JWQ89_4390 [Devosia sp.]|uniref:tetratricopeptide repeat protein n=1 Tax=Devosia sp. TaxID=1871048 RepID=UPI0026031B85|nr:tetratricopeptide repeat protein [Devosia sp.]MDB5542663.1 hypothetical protein [Devosia sp.]
MTENTETSRAERRLNSWKEIAAYFGKDERTVKRWEAIRGLPVRRVPGGTRTSVFAYAAELDAWLSAPRPVAGTVRVKGTEPALRHFKLPAIAAAVLVGCVGLGIVAARAPSAPVVQAIPSEAQALYREGVVAWSSRSAAGFETAIQKFEAALAIVPDYAPAHAGLANVYNLISQYTLAPADQSYATARLEAERAVELDPGLAEAWAALGFNAFYGSYEFARSAELFEKSLALAPDNPQALQWYALTSMQMGKFERPRQLIDRALALQPDSRSVRANAALIHYYSGDPDGAVAMLEQLRQANPDYLAVPAYLATIYLDQRRYAEFVDNYEIAARVENSAGGQSIAKAARNALPGGGRAMLAAMLEEQKHQFQVGGEKAYKVAATAALLGDRELALSYLDISVDRHETLGLLVEPEFRSLRGDRHFQALVAKLGLPSRPPLTALASP